MPGVVDFVIIRRLVLSLPIRFNLPVRHHKDDLGEIMQLFPMEVNHGHARVPVRFQISCQYTNPWSPMSIPVALRRRDVKLIDGALPISRRASEPLHAMIATQKCQDIRPGHLQ